MPTWYQKNVLFSSVKMHFVRSQVLLPMQRQLTPTTDNIRSYPALGGVDVYELLRGHHRGQQ